jgi:hypothetical protein
MAKNSTPNPSQELASILIDANKISASTVSPSSTKELVTEQEILNFIDNLSSSHGISKSLAFIAIALLFLKGACNASSPNEMSIDLVVDNEIIAISKWDLEYSCQRATGNKYLRRFAQAMAKDICSYAEKQGLAGDLANRLNNLAVASNQPILTSKEKAWSCSFAQNLPQLEVLSSERIPSLLAEDYQRRFAGNKSKPKPNFKGKKESSQELTPRVIRQGRPKSKDPNQAEESPPSKAGKTKNNNKS